MQELFLKRKYGKSIVGKEMNGFTILHSYGLSTKSGDKLVRARHSCGGVIIQLTKNINNKNKKYCRHCSPTEYQTLNHTAFKQPTPEALYWAGFLHTDGNISDNGFQIELTESDSGHLLKLAKFVDHSGKLDHLASKEVFGYQAKPTVRLRVSSRAIRNDLINIYNITPKKTFRGYPNELCTQSPDFWRGCIDGDGCIYVGKTNQIQLCGNLATCNKFCEFLLSHGIKKQPKQHRSIYKVIISAKEEVKLLLELLDYNKVSLARKALKAKEV
jgi:hypothetical protein